MLSQNYLTLRLVRVKRSEEWRSKTDGISFLFPKGGFGKYTDGANSVETRIAAGDVLVLGAENGSKGKLQAIDEAELVFWCFSLQLEHLFPLFDGYEIPLLQKVTANLRAAKRFPRTSPSAVQCHRLIEEVPPQFNLDHRSQLLRVAAAVLTEELKSVREQRFELMRVEDHLVEIFEKLSLEELLNLSASELAVKFGFSRRHLSRLFHQYFGFSMATLRMEMRLLKAVSLLRDVNAKVITVAEQSGFNHLGLFNTCFKRRFGVTPGQWRKQSGSRPDQMPNDNLVCPLHTKGLCPMSGRPDDYVQMVPKAATAQKTTVKPALAKILAINQMMGDGVPENHNHMETNRQPSKRLQAQT